MEHLVLFGIFINLIIGTWAVVYLYQKHKYYAVSFLQPIVHYTVFYNLGVLSLFIYFYLEINLPENLLQNGSPVYRDIGFLFISLFEIGLVYSMFRIYLRFRERELWPGVRKGVILAVVILILSYGVRVLLPQQSAFYKWLNVIHTGIWDNFMVFEIPILIAMLIHRKRSQDRRRRKINNAFALFYLSRYMILLIIIVFGLIISPNVLFFVTGIPRPIKLIIGLLIFMSFNIIPIVWFKHFFLEYAESMLKIIEDRGVLSAIYEKYNISKREKEILKLVLDGKSNKEIEDTLFISYHTVKNHIYSLYQKLGINNRYQLIHFITKFQNRK